jgi:hypothetical protein
MNDGWHSSYFLSAAIDSHNSNPLHDGICCDYKDIDLPHGSIEYLSLFSRLSRRAVLALHKAIGIFVNADVLEMGTIDYSYAGPQDHISYMHLCDPIFGHTRLDKVASFRSNGTPSIALSNYIYSRLESYQQAVYYDDSGIEDYSVIVNFEDFQYRLVDVEVLDVVENSIVGKVCISGHLPTGSVYLLVNEDSKPSDLIEAHIIGDYGIQHMMVGGSSVIDVTNLFIHNFDCRDSEYYLAIDCSRSIERFSLLIISPLMLCSDMFCHSALCTDNDRWVFGNTECGVLPLIPGNWISDRMRGVPVYAQAGELSEYVDVDDRWFCVKAGFGSGFRMLDSMLDELFDDWE